MEMSPDNREQLENESEFNFDAEQDGEEGSHGKQDLFERSHEASAGYVGKSHQPSHRRMGLDAFHSVANQNLGATLNLPPSEDQMNNDLNDVRQRYKHRRLQSKQ